MKKILFMSIALILTVLLVSCKPDGSKAKWNIWMITDSGTITDRSFNQGTWEGINEFANSHEGVEAHYYQPNGVSDTDYIEAVDAVVENGANVVVTPGFLFEVSIYQSQDKYPDVYFILIDGEPHNADYTSYHTADNTTNILFKEEQSGFLAGYASVTDGFRNLGFVGGMEVPAVKRFGIGYVAGAYYAAEQLGQSITFAASHYWYAGKFTQDPSHQTKATSWYNSGVEVIFAAAGSVGLDVMLAAEQLSNKYVIGVDVDQSGESDKVISSAVKRLAVAVQEVLGQLVEDEWAGGVTLNLGAVEDAIGLPTDSESWGWKTFTLGQYTSILASLKNGSLNVPTSKATLTTFLANHCGNPSITDLVAVTETV
jgi:basic membrane protein A